MLIFVYRFFNICIKGRKGHRDSRDAQLISYFEPAVRAKPLDNPGTLITDMIRHEKLSVFKLPNRILNNSLQLIKSGCYAEKFEIIFIPVYQK